LKVAYFGGDAFYSCFKLILEQKIDVTRVYINEPDESAQRIVSQCNKLKIEVKKERPTYEELTLLINEGVELFVVASYRFKLPQTSVPFAINIHPALLPKGRGPMPLPFIIENPEFAGVTIHKLTDKFDSGDIVLQEKVSLSKCESISSLIVKSNLVARKLLGTFFHNMSYLYERATPQNEMESIYYPMPSIEQRGLNWSMNLEEIKLLIRKYGHFGIFMNVNEKPALLNNIEVTRLEHEFIAGTLIYDDCDFLAVAVTGGFICIPKETNLHSSYRAKY